jgi:hypothetical protein
VSTTQSNYPLESQFIRLHKFLQPTLPLLLGLGQTSPWSIEASPPNPDISAPTINELFIYFHIRIKKAAIPTTSISDDTFNNNGILYKLIDNPSINDIRSNLIKHIYLETTVNHTNLRVASFRSLGIYYLEKIYNEVETQINYDDVIEPSEVEAVPIFYQNFLPVDVVEDLRQTFKLIIEV